MTSYYELLKVKPGATSGQIQAAYDTLYNQQRRLVTHHDPKVVTQANQDLQVLEFILATLLDPVKRASYDATLNIGGLADPEALLRQAGSMTPSVPHSAAQPAGSRGVTQASNLWVCPKCRADNPTHTRHCFKCGTELVRQCPECGERLSLVASGFCGGCGYPYDLAMQRAELKQKVALAELEYDAVKGVRPSWGCGWQIFTFMSVILFVFALTFMLNSFNGKLPYFIPGMVGSVLSVIIWIALLNKWKHIKQKVTETATAKENELRKIRQAYKKLELQKGN